MVRAQIAQTRRVIADERRPLIVVIGPVGRLGGILRHGSGEVGGAAARAAEAVEVAADAGCGSRLTLVSMSGATSYMIWELCRRRHSGPRARGVAQTVVEYWQRRSVSCPARVEERDWTSPRPTRTQETRSI